MLNESSLTQNFDPSLSDAQIYPQLCVISAFPQEENKISEYLANFKELDKREIYKNASIDENQVEIYMLFSHYFERMDDGK